VTITEGRCDLITGKYDFSVTDRICRSAHIHRKLILSRTLIGPLVWNLRKANTSNAEFEWHRGFLRKRDGIFRLLAYVNNGNMGLYQFANEQYLAGIDVPPNLADHPLQVTTKYGFGFNFEQALTRNILTYGRFGWNNGKTESWSFTEIDQTFAGGVGLLGRMWKRKFDASNGITSEHARYLSYGGLGLVLGDGGLKCGRESLMESYYTAHVWRGVYLGPDLQYFVNPGYNQARGPVLVPSFRLHLEL
jgi:high affinity Mn2+ porin